MSAFGDFIHGSNRWDIVGRRNKWYALSGVFVLLSLFGLGVRHLNLGIDFTGGAAFTAPSNGHSIDDVETTVDGLGVGEPLVQAIGSNSDEFRIQTRELTDAELEKVRTALATTLGVARDQVSPSTVGAKWGDQVTKQAVKGLVIFLLLVIVYISLRFEWRMAASAIITLIHDVLITMGIYALIGFEVTPATVTAFLSILGYSLYDTIVVFDKVKENTQGLAAGSRMTYSEAVNLSLNQVLFRSLNTSLTALLPVAALLFVGAGLLKAGTLKDLALALFIGLIVGAYSSVFFATPMLAQLKEHEPQFKALAVRVQQRRSGAIPKTGRAIGGKASPQRSAVATLEPDADAASGADADVVGAPAAASASAAARPRPRPQQQRKRKGGRGGRPSGKKRR